MVKNGMHELEPYIDFNGRNLLTPKTMKDEFIPLYNDIYLELFCVHYGVDLAHERRFTHRALKAVHEKGLP
jgi:hypothetical protein